MRREQRYLLHLWSDGAGDDTWRARIVELTSRNEHQFGSLEALTEFLQDALGVSAPRAGGGSEPGDR